MAVAAVADGLMAVAVDGLMAAVVEEAVNNHSILSAI